MEKMMPEQVDKYTTEETMFAELPEEVRRDYQSLCATVVAVLRDSHAVVRYWMMRNLDDGILNINIGIDAPPVEVAELNMRIADKMAELEESHSGSVIFMCLPAQRGD